MTLSIGIALFAVLAWAGWMTWYAELRYRRKLERSHARERSIWTTQLDALAKTIHYGSVRDDSAVVSSPEPSVEERAARAFGEEALDNGVLRLREEYAAVGVTDLTDAMLREEAVSILFGATPMSSVPLLVRDSP